MMIEIHHAEIIHKDELFTHPSNSNRQTKHVFAELRKSIRENGFDETLIVVPRDEEEGFGYWIVSGNHRFKAGVAEGMEKFPCVKRDDWDEVKEQIELVRRNYVRGGLDKDSFTVAVDTLAEGHALSIDDIRAEMGFADSEKFMELYRSEEEQQEKIERVRSENAPKVKMIDDLGMVLSSIFEQYGDTVDQSFIIFPAGGRKHMFVAATPALRRVLGDIAAKCVAEHMDINMILGGLLVIGMENSQFKTPEADAARIMDAGNEEGDSEID
jgi:hypothetical protein